MLSKEDVINRAIQKSERALQDAQSDFDEESLDSALNRLYYAIFYIVAALGYKYDFVTSKHATLMGWFNKKFVHEDKIFDMELYIIYRNAFEFRNQSDYDFTFHPNEDIVEDLLKQAEKFIDRVKLELFK